MWARCLRPPRFIPGARRATTCGSWPSRQSIRRGVWSRHYDPYGNQATLTASAPNYFAFQSGNTNPSGLIRYGKRYTNPTDQRWTQQDPLNQIADLTQADRYSFDGGDPINLTDQTGCRSLASAYALCVKRCVTVQYGLKKHRCDFLHHIPLVGHEYEAGCHAGIIAAATLYCTGGYCGGPFYGRRG